MRTTSWHEPVGTDRGGTCASSGSLSASSASARALDGALRVHELGDGARVLFEVLDAQSQGHPLPRAERVDEERERRAGDVLEEKRRPARLHDAVGDGGDLEAWVDAAPDAHELRALLERTNERAHAVPRHRRASDTSFKIF